MVGKVARVINQVNILGPSRTTKLQTHLKTFLIKNCVPMPLNKVSLTQSYSEAGCSDATHE